MLDWIASIPPESYVKVRGTVQEAKVDSCSVQTVELNGYQVFLLNRSEERLPIQVNSKEEEPNYDTILNHRVLDL